VDSLAQKKAAAQAKAQVLQQVLQDVQSQQRRLADKVAEQAKLTGQMREKQQQYIETQKRYNKRLAGNGFTPEVRCRGGQIAQQKSAGCGRAVCMVQ
jgi:hypothetical protein